MARLSGRQNGSRDLSRPVVRADNASDLIPGATTVRHVAPTGCRLFDLDGAAHYMGVSGATVLRLINAGVLAVVKVPVERGADGLGKKGVSRRVLIDVRDLDDLIDSCKETRG